MSLEKQAIKWAIENGLVQYDFAQRCVVDQNNQPLKTHPPKGSEPYWRVTILSHKSTRGRQVRLHVLVGSLKYPQEILYGEMHAHHVDHDLDNNDWDNIEAVASSDHHREDSHMQAEYQVYQRDGRKKRYIGGINGWDYVLALAKTFPNLVVKLVRGRVGKNRTKQWLDLSEYYQET